MMDGQIQHPCPQCGAELVLLHIDVAGGGSGGAVCDECGYNPAGLSAELLADIKALFEED